MQEYEVGRLDPSRRHSGPVNFMSLRRNSRRGIEITVQALLHVASRLIQTPSPSSHE